WTSFFNESDALYPSIYLSHSLNMTSDEKVRYVHAILTEAQRISRKYSPPLPIYAYTKIEYDPLKQLNSFYDDVLTYTLSNYFYVPCLES
ncbi:hypothetical protein OESDEN_18472, partial [Oesophagostomum dentatum]